MLKAALVVLAVLAQVEPAQPAAAESLKGPLQIKMWLATAGPYGEVWTAELDGSGAVALRIFYQSGKVEGAFQLGASQVASIRRSVEDADFFELPADIGPEVAPLHMPDFRLEVQDNARNHKVALYNPADAKGSAKVKRFLSVWNAIFGCLPIKPSW
jgi:hypothetical protein